MPIPRIDAALRLADTTREVLIGHGALRSAEAVLRRQFGDGPALIVADENTHAAAGREVIAGLEAAGRETAGPASSAAPSSGSDCQMVKASNAAPAVAPTTAVQRTQGDITGRP